MEDTVAEESYQLLAAAVVERQRAAEPPPPGPPQLSEHAVDVSIDRSDPDAESPSVGDDRSPRKSIVQLRPPRGPDGHSRHHTMVPRMMVTAGLLAALGSPLFFLVLYQQDHFDIVGNDWFFDARGRELAKAAVTAVAACTTLGWLWWTTAAALNARHRARYGVSPFFASIAALVIIGSGVLLPQILDSLDERPGDRGLIALFVVLLLASVVAFFGTLTAYRRSAGAIGASQRPWNVIIIVPWVMVALNLFAQFFTKAVGDNFLTVIGVVNLTFLGVMVLALYQGMSSFDRACIGRQMSHSDRADVPDFLRRSK